MVQQDAAAASTYTIPAMADILVMYSTYDGNLVLSKALAGVSNYTFRVLLLEESKSRFVVHREFVQRTGRTCQKQRSGNDSDVCEQKNGHAVSELRSQQLQYAP